MIKLWVLVMVAIGPNGEIASNLHITSKPEYNTEQSCGVAGKVITESLQDKLGPEVKTYWKCHSLELKDIEKALPLRV